MWGFSARRVRGLCFHLLVKRENSYGATAHSQADAHLETLHCKSDFQIKRAYLRCYLEHAIHCFSVDHNLKRRDARKDTR